MFEFLGIDLAVVPKMTAQDASQVDLVAHARVVKTRLPGAPEEVVDLAVLSGRENLAQGLILRLLTPRGSLAALGHAAYGSELHKLIGQLKTEELRNLCRAYVLDVVQQEPRVENKALSFSFESDREGLDSFVFTIAVQPKDTGVPVGLTLEFAL